MIELSEIIIVLEWMLRHNRPIGRDFLVSLIADLRQVEGRKR